MPGETNELADYTDREWSQDVWSVERDSTVNGKEGQDDALHHRLVSALNNMDSVGELFETMAAPHPGTNGLVVKPEEPAKASHDDKIDSPQAEDLNTPYLNGYGSQVKKEDPKINGNGPQVNGHSPHVANGHSSNGPQLTNGHIASNASPIMNGHITSDPTAPEPIAIVGMAFRFPAGAETESDFWDMLVSQRCASSEFPPDRINIDAFYNADAKKPHSIYTRRAHFLKDDIRAFDAKHFGISRLEAGAMDPNQRGLMETTYHALENAGIKTSEIAGTNTSVHIGFFSSDHMTFNFRDALRIPKYYATGSSASILANRISWNFNLRGPSMTIDTACSSGLVAMDLAVQGLRAGTSDTAIVGAANLILSPELNIALCNMNMLSPDGKCFSFDHRASGYSRGEGFSVLVLKPLSKALAAGDTIRALVRSIGSNQDGHTNGGITQPSRELQAQLIRDTYAKAGLDMRTTRYFEAHGTGTSIGDPTEARAIGESFRQYRTDTSPLYVGAVKSNIGHLEGASGLAGVIKAVLALEKGIIPPNTNFEKLNPLVDDEFFRLKFPQECVQWPEGEVRRASVNSFGFGGSNAHVVLDDAGSYLNKMGLGGNHFSVKTRLAKTNGYHVDQNHVDEPILNGDLPNGEHTAEPVVANGNHSDKDLTNGDLTNGVLTDGDLTNGDLTNSGLTNSDLTNSDLTNGDLTNGTLSNGHLNNDNHINDVEVNGNRMNGEHTNGVKVNGEQTIEHQVDELRPDEPLNGVIHINGQPRNKQQDGVQIEEPQEDSTATFSPKLIILTSSDDAGIPHQIEAHNSYVEQIEASSLGDILPSYSHTLAKRRTHLPWRTFGVLDSLSNASSLKSCMSSSIHSPGEPSSLGFVFTGQGAQWHGMGRELLSEPVFSDSIERSQKLLEALGCSWSISDHLSNKVHAASIGEPQFSQILTTCVQIAIVDLVAWLDITPTVVVGHSSGEIAAAYAAGHISQAAAVKVSYYRGLLASKIARISVDRCSMAAIGLSREDAAAEIEALEQDHNSGLVSGSLTISCINSPFNVTVSGLHSQLQLLVDHMTQEQIFARMLKVDVGYHSPQMTLISGEYLELLSNLEPGQAGKSERPIMVSSVTGEVIDAQTVCTGKYWVRNMVSPVNFLSAMRFCNQHSKPNALNNRIDKSHLEDVHVNGWLEIGPHAALRGPTRETLKVLSREKEVTYTSALIRGKSAISSILAAGGELFCRSFPVNMSHLVLIGLSSAERSTLRVLPNLPKYQFSRSTLYWEEPQANKDFRLRKFGNHDLLGAMINEPNAIECQWKFIIKEDEMPWVVDHKVDGVVLYPAAGMIVMAIEAAKQLAEDGLPAAFYLEHVEFPAPIVLSDAPEGVEVRIHMSSNAKGGKRETDHKFRIFVYKPDGTHELTCSGTIRGDYGHAKSNFEDEQRPRGKNKNAKAELESVTAVCTRSLPTRQMYQTILEETGLEYGPYFQSLDNVHFHDSGKAKAKVVARVPDTTTDHTVHPSRLDGIFQLAFAALHASNQARGMVPTFVSSLWIPLEGFGHDQQKSETAFAIVQQVTTRTATFDIKTVEGPEATLRTEIRGLEVTAVATVAETTTSLEDAPYLCSQLEWKVDFDALNAGEMQGYCDSARSTAAEPVEFFNNMDALVFQYGVRALAKVDELGGYVTPSMEKYARWLRLHTGLLHDTPLMTDVELEQLCSLVSNTTRGEMHIKIGQHLVEFLRGEADPLQLIFADEAKVTDFYRELMENTTGVSSLHRYLDLLVHKNPALRFLEVGAGTGSSTKAIMRAIGNTDTSTRFEEYMYTDISPSFFEQASSKFSNHSRMKYQVLNVEKDVGVQDFELGAYDVVIADNVLHATTNLHNSLSNVRKLLRPGGTLILKELSTPERLLTGFAFGLLPGWWLSEEEERELSPLLTEKRWDELLHETGFSGIDLKFADHLSDKTHVWTIMIAAAVEDNHSPSPLEASPHSQSQPESRSESQPRFVIDPSSTLQKDVALSLARELNFPSETQLLSIDEAARFCETEPNLHSFIFLNELESSVLLDIEESGFDNLQKFLGNAACIIWVKQGAKGDAYSSPEYGMGDGLCRVTRRENHNVVVSVCVEKADLSSVTNIAKVYFMTEEMQSGTRTVEQEYQEIDGKLCVSRLTRAKALDAHIFKRTARPVLHERVGDKKLKIGIRAPGLLDTIEFSEDNTFGLALGASEVDVEVHAIGINYKDCLTLLGKFDSNHLGSECSGIVKAIGKDVTHVKVGDRVLVAAHDVFQTYVRAPARAAIRIPDTMAFTEAASLCTAFCAAYYSIFNIARLQEGETILIHAAAGGTGQAMVQLAQLVGAEIYATVGSSAKKDLLVNEYGIPKERIFYSRDDSFVESLMDATNGRGVDVIINSQQGRLLEASWNCIATGGRFLDIGLKDAYLRGQLPMHVFTRSATYAGVNLAPIMLHEEKIARVILESVVKLFEDRKAHILKPLHVYPLEEIEQALRFLQSGKSSGKIVLQVNKAATLPVVQGSESEYTFRHDATYVIAGGLGGIGRSMTRWLVKRGARHIILLSRSAGNERAREMVTELNASGVNVRALACDIADFSSLEAGLRECQTTMPPIRGCIQAAMVLRDSIFAEMSFSDWTQSTRPKVQGSWNLHKLLPRGMDFFFLLSSCAGILGHTGQSNYCAGNTYQDAFAQYRASIGEKALSIDVGVVLGEGFVAENEEVFDKLMRIKLFNPNTLAEIFSIMDHYCDPKLERVEVVQSQIITGFELPADIVAKGGDVPTALEQPVFRCFAQAPGSYRTTEQSSTSSLNFHTAFTTAPTAEAGALVVAEALKAKLGRVLGMATDQFTLDSTLDSFGVDSLVGLELRNWLAKESGAALAVFEILGGVSLRDIGKTVVGKSNLRPDTWKDE